MNAYPRATGAGSTVMRGLFLAAAAAFLSGGAAVAETSGGFVKRYDPLASMKRAEHSPADPDDAVQVAQGRLLYAEHCAACHGAALEGAVDWETPEADGSYRPPPHDDSGHTWHHSDRQLFEYVKLGGEKLFEDYPDIVSNMPGFGDVLSDDAIWDIFAFIKESWSKENLDWQRTVSQTDPLPGMAEGGADD